MLSRAFTTQSETSPKTDEKNSSTERSLSIIDYEDCIFGFMNLDQPLITLKPCHNRFGALKTFKDILIEHDQDKTGIHITQREVLRGTLGVVGEGCLGMTEKVIFGNKICAVKRFWKVKVGSREFGRKIKAIEEISNSCKNLVPLSAYFYSKRVKFVISDYYPLGSLADLLAGAREHGHTNLNWNQRLRIILDIAKTIAFIHSQSYPNDKHKQKMMNIHGSIKVSNIMIDADFSAHVANYGFALLATRVEFSDMWRYCKAPPQAPENLYCCKLGQKGDIYNFGIIMLELLGGLKAKDPGMRKCIIDKKEKIIDGTCGFFEAYLNYEEKKEALKVLDIALACTNTSAKTRPCIRQVLDNLENVRN